VSETMSVADTRIADEQIRYWRARGWSSEMAWRALHNAEVERNNALWCDVRAFMLRWLDRKLDRAA
jgi:hypothetical protein